MFRQKCFVTISILLWSSISSAQFNNDRISSPLFGGPGDYVYPVVCTACNVWQDYRNFAWNQLTINGGNARTPTNPGNVTSFRIYTHSSNDYYPAMVEITLEIVDVELMGETVGRRPSDRNHYFVETHPENGDRVQTSDYPANMGPLVFPYQSSGSNNGGSSGGGGSSSGGGGDSSGGSSGGGYGGAGAGGGSSGSGYGSGYGGGNYCGAGTAWDCVHVR